MCSKVATKKGEELYLFGQQKGGSEGGAWQQEGGPGGGGGGDEEGGCLCTCVSVAPWEKGRKQDLKVKQHPVNPPPPIPEVFMLFFLLLSAESGKGMIQSEHGLCKGGTGEGGGGRGVLPSRWPLLIYIHVISR